MQMDLGDLGHQLSTLDSRHGEQDATCATRIRIMVRIMKINHFLDSRLDNDFGTLVAREHGHVQYGILQTGTALVEDRIHFGVANVGILGVESIVGVPSPRQRIVRSATGKPIVSQPHDSLLRIHQTGTHLGIGVLGTFGGEKCHGHKILLPRQVITPFGDTLRDTIPIRFPFQQVPVTVGGIVLGRYGLRFLILHFGRVTEHGQRQGFQWRMKATRLDACHFEQNPACTIRLLLVMVVSHVNHFLDS
mmetsp:Transcript_16267/g.37374  ORF Transcript_16267/g.37374 Transcript_16267/m.37374 type:complete len:248 (-) Transcript_16267:561-1304(-)